MNCEVQASNAGPAPSEPAEGIEQALAPRSNWIVGGEEREGADAARPLERAKHRIIGIKRALAAEKWLVLEREAQRREACAECRQALFAIDGEGLERRADAFFAGLAEIIAVLLVQHMKNIERDKREDGRDERIAE